MMTVDSPGSAAAVLPSTEIKSMNHPFKVGDRVRWNSEAGMVSGRIIKVHTHDTAYKGHTRRCSPEDPQYEILIPDLLSDRQCLGVQRNRTHGFVSIHQQVRDAI